MNESVFRSMTADELRAYNVDLDNLANALGAYKCEADEIIKAQRRLLESFERMDQLERKVASANRILDHFTVEMHKKYLTIDIPNRTFVEPETETLEPDKEDE